MPINSNEKLLNLYLRHQTRVLRTASGMQNKLVPILTAKQKQVERLILEKLISAPNRTLTGSKGKEWQTKFDNLIVNLKSKSWDKITKKLNEDLKEFAIAEANIAAVAIEGSVPVILNMKLPPATQLEAIISSQPFQGATLKTWMQRTKIADVHRLLSRAKIGIIQGETPLQILAGIRDLNKRARRDLESVILTLTNGVQQEAKQKLYELNSDVIKEEYFVATLDSSTTLICGSNDSKTFKRGQGPIPPLHFRCRSLRVPYADPNILLQRPFDPTTEKMLLKEYANEHKLGRITSRDNLPRGYKTKFDSFAMRRKRELIGTIPGKTSYPQWLKNQSMEFQNEILGVTRAKMFRKGNLTLDKFVARDGDTLTLTQLKAKGLKLPEEA